MHEGGFCHDTRLPKPLAYWSIQLSTSQLLLRVHRLTHKHPIPKGIVSVRRVSLLTALQL